MIKTIIKKQNIETNSAQHETKELADAWLAQEVANNSFGRPERWVSPYASGEYQGEVVEESIGARDVLNPITRKIDVELKFSADYTIEQVDISSEIEEQNKLKERKDLRAAGFEILDFVYNLNESKYENQLLTLQDLVAMESYEPILKLEEQLRRGTLKTAKYSLQNYAGLYYTQDDINLILEKVNTALGV